MEPKKNVQWAEWRRDPERLGLVREASILASEKTCGFSCSVKWPRDVYKSKTAWVTTAFYLEPLWRHRPYFLWRKQVAPLDSSFLDCQLVTRNGVIYILYSALAQPGKACMWTGWHLVAFSNCFPNEPLSPCFVIGSSAGAASSCWPPSSHSLILSRTPRNLAVSFLRADLVGYVGKVLKEWRPHILHFLDNSDNIMSRCQIVGSSLEFEKHNYISQVLSPSIDVLGMMPPPFLFLNWNDRN